MSLPPIPQTNPKAALMAQRAAIDRAIAEVLDSGWYILGERVARFERAFAEFLGSRHGVGVGNGTDALVLALKALELAPGDYVATVPHTAVATVAAIELAGARPLLVDIDEATCTMDPSALEAALARPPGRVAAILPVHLYGQAADLDALLPLARRHGAWLVEDCAQCHGATLGERPLGSIGELACFSFYPTKNLGAIGDGGMVVTGDDALAERLRVLREYGWRERYVSAIAGVNSRLDELQAAILEVKLRTLADDNRRRQAIARAYDEGLAGLPLGLPARREGAGHVFHQYVVRHAHRDALRLALKARGIGTLVHYPVPVHLQPAYQGRLAIGPGGLARSERAGAEVLSLPMFPQLTPQAVARVVAGLREVLAELG